MSEIIECGTTGYAAQRIFCVGRNYAAHAAELGNRVPERPLLFMKPPSALLGVDDSIRLPQDRGAVHHEAELVILIGQAGTVANSEVATAFIAGFTLGLDLTLRDLQDQLKKDGHPWERAKAFDGSAVIGDMVPYLPEIHDFTRMTFEAWVNNDRRQTGNTADLLMPVADLLMEISATWPLRVGDLIFTGTPAGVGPITSGDRIRLTSPQIGSFEWAVL